MVLRPPEPTGEEDQGNHGCCCECLPDARTTATSQPPAEVVPDLRAVVVGALWNRQIIDECEHTAEGVVLGAAVRAGIQVQLGRSRFDAVVVIAVQDELLFIQVLHGLDLTKGSSDSRNLRTARKIVCLAALTWIPSVLPISSTGIPSKWRSTNALRSLPVSCSMALLTSTCSS